MLPESSGVTGTKASVPRQDPEPSHDLRGHPTVENLRGVCTEPTGHCPLSHTSDLSLGGAARKGRGQPSPGDTRGLSPLSMLVSAPGPGRQLASLQQLWWPRGAGLHGGGGGGGGGRHLQLAGPPGPADLTVVCAEQHVRGPPASYTFPSPPPDRATALVCNARGYVMQINPLFHECDYTSPFLSKYL